MKTAIERKNQSEKILTDFDIPFNSELPPLKQEKESELRTAKEIADRVLVLSYLCYSAEEEEEKPKVIKFLKKQNLWNSVTPIEKKQFLSKEKFSEDELNNISWKSESIWTLLWAIMKVDIFDLPILEIELSDYIEVLPDFLKSPKAFIDSSELRDKSIILDKSDLLFRLEWTTRNNKQKELFINSNMIKERNNAIKWLSCYKYLDWDDITTEINHTTSNNIL